MNHKIKPIIKWTGGKYKEFALFEAYIPSFERYIEPFFGGGGVFFALQPKKEVVINDKSTDLINFYKQISKPNFRAEIYDYATAWDEVTDLCEVLWEGLVNEFSGFIAEHQEQEALQKRLYVLLKELLPKYTLLNTASFVVNSTSFFSFLTNSVLDKAQRIKRICHKEGRLFNAAELKDHFCTGIKSGMYLFFRNVMNKSFSGEIKLSPAKAAANWYFVREFCYASMFRYNAKGEFNIPYGGIAYNRKNFRQKADLIFEATTQQLFKNTKVFNEDFEHLLKRINLSSTDFIFLDPPYDSEFSEYDQNAFTKDDQKRLANFLLSCPAKWMVVIKETEFIRDIYTHPRVNILTFGKKYTYNVRGRNDRAVTHLIITNY